MENRTYLTKSRYAAGLQCMRRLWLSVHEPAEWEAPELGSTADLGQEIGRVAHQLFPGGILVDEKPWQHQAAAARTTALMADPSVPAIFEAAFEHAGIRIRVDVLERLPGSRWGLREVKSSTSVKAHHFDDVALQMYVLSGVGVALSSVEIVYVNKMYVRAAGAISWSEFFSRLDVSADAGTRIDGIDERLEHQRACLALSKAPIIEPEAHCHAPISCEYWDRCTQTKPADWVYYLPKFRASRRAELGTIGVDRISAIPDDFPLSPRQRIIRNVTRSVTPFVADDLATRLHEFGPPALYLDFEAFLPAVPLFPSTRPYQTLPFQWSLHSVNADGIVDHQEFLAAADSDPRRPFAETLVTALAGSDWPVIVYSPYEQTQLNTLAPLFPDLAEAINDITRRLRDLLPVVREGIYHPAFGFSNSIKAVAPALCPDFTYQDLEDIADGSGASSAFWLMASGRADMETTARLRRALLAYCERDTWAMVRLHQALRELTHQSIP